MAISANQPTDLADLARSWKRPEGGRSDVRTLKEESFPRKTDAPCWSSSLVHRPCRSPTCAGALTKVEHLFQICWMWTTNFTTRCKSASRTLGHSSVGGVLFAPHWGTLKQSQAIQTNTSIEMGAVTTLTPPTRGLNESHRGRRPWFQGRPCGLRQLLREHIIHLAY